MPGACGRRLRVRRQNYQRLLSGSNRIGLTLVRPEEGPPINGPGAPRRFKRACDTQRHANPSRDRSLRKFRVSCNADRLHRHERYGGHSLRLPREGHQRRRRSAVVQLRQGCTVSDQSNDQNATTETYWATPHRAAQSVELPTSPTPNPIQVTVRLNTPRNSQP